MNITLLTYALIKTIYELKQDYVDTFWPFVLYVLPKDNKSLSLNIIQSDIKTTYGLEIPEHSLKSIITRAKKRGYIEVQKWNTKLSENGKKYLESHEPEGDINRKINALLVDIKAFINDPSLTTEDIHKILSLFVKENIFPLICFLNPSVNKPKFEMFQTTTNKIHDLLIHYFEIAENEKPGFYAILKDIVYGSLISVTAFSQNITEVNKKFKDVELYLDTNYLFSILGLDYENLVKPAKELFSLIRTNEFKLKVFDFTIEEMISVLKNYPNQQYYYIKGVRVNSIYSVIKGMGWTIEDLKEFIQKIEEHIWNLGITIEPTGILLKEFRPKHEQSEEKISLYKKVQGDRYKKHDIAAIEKIIEIRGRSVRQIEKTNSLFLTSDLKLASFDFNEFGHKDNMTVCEVIPDRLLTNILWLKNPTVVKDIPLKTIIALQSKNVLIDRNIWIRFFENIKNLKNQGKIDDKDISMLFYNHYIDRILSKYNESDVDIITDDFVLEEIIKAGKGIDDEVLKKLDEQKKVYKEEFVQTELESRWSKKIEDMKTIVSGSARKSAKNWTNISALLLIIPLVLIFRVLIIPVVKFWSVVEPFAWLISIFFSIIVQCIGLKYSVRKLRNQIESNLYNTILKRKLKELKL
jgi:hypothetical protein